MDWRFLTIVAVFVNVAASKSVGYPCAVPAAGRACGPTLVDGNVVQSLIDTIQLFIVSDLVEETLQEKKVIVPSAPEYVDYEYYDDSCDILPYEFVFDEDCPDFVTALAPRPVPKVCNVASVPKVCNSVPKKCVNFGLNEELVLPPLAPELPPGLGYLPGALPVVAKAFAPCSRCCACGCGCTPCSSAAFPICSPYSCAALAAPLCPDMSPFVKPIIL